MKDMIKIIFKVIDIFKYADFSFFAITGFIDNRFSFTMYATRIYSINYIPLNFIFFYYYIKTNEINMTKYWKKNNDAVKISLHNSW